MNSPLLDTEEAAKVIHMQPGTLRFWRHKGTGPKYFRVGGHKVYYRQEDVEAWMNEQYAASNPAS